MSSEKYVAYVGTYTHGNSVGIHLYDLDVERGRMAERKVFPINNPSHLTISKDGRFLYSIADEGVEAFQILPDGDLKSINKEWIGGMRGCYVEVDDQNRYLFVGGYHDARVTMMRLRPDGGIEGIAAGIFHKGMGRKIAERNSRPHVNGVVLSPKSQDYICAVDGGLDHVKIYQIDYGYGKMVLEDILRCPLESAPRMLRFTKDGRFAYVLCELKNTVEVYAFESSPQGILADHIQSIPTVQSKDIENGGASAMELSRDGKYMFCSNAGTNSVVVYQVDDETGMLTLLCSNYISGEYPKALGIFPDGNHFIVLNHDSNEIRIFHMDYEKNCFLMDGPPIAIDTPNCIRIHKLCRN